MNESMLMKQYIAFKGTRFTIEWYYDSRGKSQAKEYFEELSVDEQKKVFYLFEAMANLGKIINEEKFRHEGDQIYAFKPMSYRFLSFFFIGSKIIVTNAFEKKGQKLPSKEKVRALHCRQDYEKQVKNGFYYDK